MKYSLFVLSILLQILLSNSSNYDPTSSELSRYEAVINPSLLWGEQARREQSIRLLILGGSISRGCCCESGNFGILLSKFVAQYNNSYVLNRAVSGVRPYKFLGDSYEFELQPKDRWPNIILIELTLNSDNGWSTAQQLDNLLFSFDEKWITNGLPRPDVIFLDLFSVISILSSFKGNDTKENRIKHLNSFDSTNLGEFNRGSNSQIYINALARYYSYPVLSNIEMLWPAFCRHFVNNPVVSLSDSNVDRKKLWPYTFDGVHPTCLGHEFIANQVIIRFLKHQMNRPVHLMNKSLELSNNDEDDQLQYKIRMFPQHTYVTLLQKWDLWVRKSNAFDDFQAILKPSSGWNLTFLNNGHHQFHDGHDCYGSDGINSHKAIFVLNLPKQCQECTIGISYLHSWNTSYIGDVSCNLYIDYHHNNSNNNHDNHHREGNDSRLHYEDIKMIEIINIQGSKYKGMDMKASYPQETKFLKALSSGKYIIKCTKLDSKFACFSQLAVYLK